MMAAEAATNAARLSAEIMSPPYGDTNRSFHCASTAAPAGLVGVVKLMRWTSRRTLVTFSG
jgi:hypothetical protein